MADLKVMEPFPQTSLDDEDHVLAARITGEGESKIDVVVIADLDFLSDIFYTHPNKKNMPNTRLCHFHTTHSSRNVSTLKGVLSLKFKTAIVFPKAASVKSGLK